MSTIIVLLDLRVYENNQITRPQAEIRPIYYCDGVITFSLKPIEKWYEHISNVEMAIENPMRPGVR